MAHTDVATFLADKAVVQRVGFTTHTQLRLSLILILYRIEGRMLPKMEKEKSFTIIYAFANFCQFCQCCLN